MVTVNDDTSDVAGPTTGGRVPVGRGAIEIRRRARRAARDSAPSATVFLVIDCSGSMAGQNLERARIGSVEFAESALASGYAVGLIQFASTATMVCEPQRDLSALREAADRLEAGGFTEMGRGIAMADADLGSRGGRRAMIVVTDGLPNQTQGRCGRG